MKGFVQIMLTVLLAAGCGGSSGSGGSGGSDNGGNEGSAERETNVSGSRVCLGGGDTVEERQCYDFTLDRSAPQELVDTFCENLVNPTYPDTCPTENSEGACEQTISDDPSYRYLMRWYGIDEHNRLGCEAAGGVWHAD